MAVLLQTIFEAFYTFPKITTIKILLQEFSVFGPDGCGSMGWVLSCGLEVCWFNSQCGHVLGLWSSFLAGGLVRGN